MLTLQFNNKRFPMDKKLRDNWDEVERDNIKNWKEWLEKTKATSPFSEWTLKNIAGEGKSLGYKVKIADGRHR